MTEARSEFLDQLIRSAGYRTTQGYWVEDELVAWIIECGQPIVPIVVAEQDGHFWLLTEVGLVGGTSIRRTTSPKKPPSSFRQPARSGGRTPYERAILAQDLGDDLHASGLSKHCA